MVRPPRFARAPRHRPLRQRLDWLRWAVPLALILLAWHAWNRADVRAAIGLPLPVPRVVAARFALCSAPGHAEHCVIDGDTFVIGRRHVRVAGIDAPELHGRCPAESAAAARATLASQTWLNAGPFTLDPAEEVVRDKYGRELQRPLRGDEALADQLVGAGHALRFERGARPTWC